ncbi:uncharacterized protein LOC116110509, partial [Pistacia vera]|uniref:uncharacterized protein LOC116110509 n=1 Tax=Pistacia vera TaxID=55513 RepID=UPI0012635CBA
KRAGAGLFLSSPGGTHIHGILQFGFKVTNNEVEYEALLAKLRLAREMGSTAISIHSDSMLVVNQILGEYQAKEENMISYLKKPKVVLEPFKQFMITQIPRDNIYVVDALAKITLSLDSDAPKSILVRFIEALSINLPKQAVNFTESVS